MEGLIAEEPAGKGGFGYDPILYLPEFGKTSAELTMEEKNRISTGEKRWSHEKGAEEGAWLIWEQVSVRGEVIIWRKETGYEDTDRQRYP